MAKIPVRYIKDWCAGSTANGASIWTEIKVFQNGENIALGILPTTSVVLNGGNGIITNGNISNTQYSFTMTYGNPQWAQIDLGQVYTDLEHIQVWHWYGDGRIFSFVKSQVSEDGVNWVTLFDSEIEGRSSETAEGLIHSIPYSDEPNIYESIASEPINLSMIGNQIYTIQPKNFESVTQQNFGLNIGAVQNYMAVGYNNETMASDLLTLSIATNTEYQANFESNAVQTIFIEDLAAATVIYSGGLQFQQNTQEIINLSQVASQAFTPFVGYEFFQNANNDFSLSDAAASLYILGETGVYNQWATTIIYVQKSTEAIYTRNWLDFEHVATENINGFTVEAVSDYQNINIFEAQAVESFTWYISPLSWYGRYFPETAQDNFSLLINAASEYTENHLTFDMQANVFFFLHYTDIALHQVNYLTIQQNMYYDFYFWDYADSVYTQNSLTFETQITENIDLSFQTVTQYINANMLNGFATENIGLFTEAAAEYVQTIINHFDHFVVESFNFVFSAISEHVGVDIYVFDGLASEIIGLAFNGTTEHIEAHLFDGLATLNIDLSDQVLSEYKHINVFTSQVFETIDFEGFGTLFVTTEPRQYSVNAYMNFSLKVVNWIYFESDIYVQTYKIEITKINTIWEPTEQDRPLVEENKRPIHEMDISDTIFSAQYKVDRQILNLTKLKGPSKITFEAESQKPNSLYTINHDNDERGLFND